MPNLHESKSYSFGASPVAGLRAYSTGHDSLTVNNSLSPPGSHVMSLSPPSSGQPANVSQQQQLPPACGARQLSKLKRFLTTLQQFGADISPGIGDHVRALILALVNSQLTVEEFHAKLQQATNFPLRPFVIPFLKANLPLLQRELLHCAHLARQSPHQYLIHHDRSVLDVVSPPPPSQQHPPPPPGIRCSSRDDSAVASAPSNVSPIGASVKRKSPDDRGRETSGGRQSSESSKRIRATPPSPITGGSVAAGLVYSAAGATSLQASAGTSSTVAVARYVDDDVEFLRDLREINRVERDQIDRDTPIDARIHSAISNGSNSPHKSSSIAERMSDDLKRVENLLEGIAEMLDECKTVVKSLRQQSNLVSQRSVDSHAEINQRAAPDQNLQSRRWWTDHSLEKVHRKLITAED